MSALKKGLSFQVRLLLSFIGLLIVAMLVAGAAVSYTTTVRINQTMNDNLNVGTRVLDNYLQNREAQLASSVEVLASDFAFISAVATQDKATIASVLLNHGNRIGADLVFLTDVQGQPVSASDTSLVEQTTFPFSRILQSAQQDGYATAISAWQNSVFQLFVFPVKAPSTIAWVGMAFKLDGSVAGDIAQLTGLAISFVEVLDQQFLSLATTLPEDSHTALNNLRLLNVSGNAQFFADPGEQYLGVAKTLYANTDPVSGIEHHIVASLQVPTALVSSARAELLSQLAVILLVTLCICLLVSLWLARQMSNPVARLIEAATLIRRGNYETRVDVDSGGEMALLGSAINTMVQGIGEREEKIKELAFLEPITQLPNRASFTQWIDGYMNASSLDDHDSAIPDSGAAAFTLCMVSLVNWRDVKFSFGPAVAEQLMARCARNLRTLVGDSGQLYAFTGFQFAIVMPDTSPAQARVRLTTIVNSLQMSQQSDGLAAPRLAGAIIGYPDDAADAQSLIRGVESTLERAESADDTAMLFLSDHEEERIRQLRLISDFESAFAQNQFHLCFQPKVSLVSKSVTECEALLRWVHPELGFIPPDEFVTLAERSGNIRRMTDWVLETAIAQAAKWHQKGVKVCVAINLSAHDLADRQLPNIVRGLMEKYQADGDMIALEITESAVLRDQKSAIEILVALKRMGLRLAIDDFGTGYSSLAQLKQLPVDELKIDKSFVLALDESPGDEVIVASTIELGHSLGLKIVAEGVENDASLRMLQNFGCDKVQGYYFSKPLRVDEFSQWWSTFKWQQSDLVNPAEKQLSA
jgi:predicted signal transduction protein with EAL and GGDEF domain